MQKTQNKPQIQTIFHPEIKCPYCTRTYFARFLPEECPTCGYPTDPKIRADLAKEPTYTGGD